MPTKRNQDDQGNESSFRENWTWFMAAIVALMVVIIFLVIKESYKDVPDYAGLAQLLYGPAGAGLISFAFKALQKKYENKG